MLQTGNVVVINGVDDGFHHKGVFLVLHGWERKFLFTAVSNPGNVNPGVNHMLCFGSFIFFTTMSTHRNNQWQQKPSRALMFCICTLVTCDPVTFGQSCCRNSQRCSDAQRDEEEKAGR